MRKREGKEKEQARLIKEKLALLQSKLSGVLSHSMMESSAAEWVLPSFEETGTFNT